MGAWREGERHLYLDPDLDLDILALVVYTSTTVYTIVLHYLVVQQLHRVDLELLLFRAHPLRERQTHRDINFAKAVLKLN